MAASKSTLLIVLPGRAGRQPVLERLQALARIVVLVPSAHIESSSWAKALVGDDAWIQFDGSCALVDNAWNAVSAWLRGEYTLSSESSSASVPARRRIDGAFSFDEFGVELGSYICEQLGVPATPATTMAMLRNKRLFRERCEVAGVPAVRYTRRQLCTQEDLDRVLKEPGGWLFPSVLKPAKGAGSWYLKKVEGPEELVREWAHLTDSMSNGSFPADICAAGFVLEEYFPGHEVDVDGWARDGKCEFCLVSDNRPAKEPYFLELGGIYPSQLPAHAIEKLEQLTQDVVAAFPGLHGAFHFEAKIDKQLLRVMPIELNARVGGAECPASVEAVSGYYLPCVAAQLALGLPCERETAPQHAVVASTNVHIFEQGIIAELTDFEVDFVANKLVTSTLFTALVGKPHQPNNGSLSCLGWMAAGGETMEEAERNLNTAVGQARVVITPAPVIGGQ